MSSSLYLMNADMNRKHFSFVSIKPSIVVRKIPGIVQFHEIKKLHLISEIVSVLQD